MTKTYEIGLSAKRLAAILEEYDSESGRLADLLEEWITSDEPFEIEEGAEWEFHSGDAGYRRSSGSWIWVTDIYNSLKDDGFLDYCFNRTSEVTDWFNEVEQ